MYNYDSSFSELVVVIFNFWTFAEELNLYWGSVYRIIGGNNRNYLLLYQVFIILMRLYARNLYVLMQGRGTGVSFSPKDTLCLSVSKRSSIATPIRYVVWYYATQHSVRGCPPVCFWVDALGSAADFSGLLGSLGCAGFDRILCWTMIGL